MATKIFTVTIEEDIILENEGTADKITQLEAQFKNIVEEVNMRNTHVQLHVTSIVAQ